MSDFKETEVVFRKIHGADVPIKVNHLYAENNRWVESLTPLEMHYIRKYTENSLESGREKLKDKYFSKMNEYLRCKQEGIGLYDASKEEQSEIISSGIRKFNLKQAIICYRGSNFDESHGTKEGELFTNPSFYSTSINAKKAFKGTYRYTIEVPPMAKCAFLGNISRYKSQKELLIDKDTKYMVISRKGNRIRLRVIV